MSNPEKSGALERYKKFNEVTRNIGLGVFGGAYLLGAMGIATIAAISVMIDQAQIMIIDSVKQRRKAQAAAA